MVCAGAVVVGAAAVDVAVGGGTGVVVVAVGATDVVDVVFGAAVVVVMGVVVGGALVVVAAAVVVGANVVVVVATVVGTAAVVVFGATVVTTVVVVGGTGVTGNVSVLVTGSLRVGARDGVAIGVSVGVTTRCVGERVRIDRVGDVLVGVGGSWRDNVPLADVDCVWLSDGESVRVDVGVSSPNATKAPVGYQLTKPRWSRGAVPAFSAAVSPAA